jgi:hypothetical protein
MSVESSLSCQTGVAAAELGFNARTYHGLFGIKEGGRGRADSYDRVEQPPANPIELAQMQRDLADLRILIIDEISFISAASLWSIHCRMCEIFTPGRLDEPFGGKCVIAMGDAFQLPPCIGSDLFTHMATRALAQQRGQVLSDSASERGILLWLRFRMIRFAAQNRSQDPLHNAFLNHFREHAEAPIGDRERRQIEDKIITADDFITDQEWLDAPCIVTNNKLRQLLNTNIWLSSSRSVTACQSSNGA